MARRVILIDDVTGKEDETVETRTFALQGRNYEIDLSAPEYDKLESALATFIVKGREITPLRAKALAGTGAGTPDDNAAARDWAREQRNEDGTPRYEIAERGRLPKEVVEDYKNYLATSKNGGNGEQTTPEPAKTPAPKK